MVWIFKRPWRVKVDCPQCGRRMSFGINALNVQAFNALGPKAYVVCRGWRCRAKIRVTNIPKDIQHKLSRMEGNRHVPYELNEDAMRASEMEEFGYVRGD